MDIMFGWLRLDFKVLRFFFSEGDQRDGARKRLTSDSLILLRFFFDAAYLQSHCPNVMLFQYLSLSCFLIDIYTDNSFIAWKKFSCGQFRVDLSVSTIISPQSRSETNSKTFQSSSGLMLLSSR